MLFSWLGVFWSLIDPNIPFHVSFYHCYQRPRPTIDSKSAWLQHQIPCAECQLLALAVANCMIFKRSRKKYIMITIFERMLVLMHLRGAAFLTQEEDLSKYCKISTQRTFDETFKRCSSFYYLWPWIKTIPRHRRPWNIDSKQVIGADGPSGKQHLWLLLLKMHLTWILFW